MTPIADSNLIAFLLLVACVGTLIALFVGLSVWFGPSTTNPAKEAPFESGWIPQTDASQPFPIKYYLVAILFIVFDVEIAFLYPWAVNFTKLGIVGFVSMMIFLVILAVGLYYAVKKRVLEWK